MLEQPHDVLQRMERLGVLGVDVVVDDLRPPEREEGDAGHHRRAGQEQGAARPRSAFSPSSMLLR